MKSGSNSRVLRPYIAASVLVIIAVLTGIVGQRVFTSVGAGLGLGVFLGLFLGVPFGLVVTRTAWGQALSQGLDRFLAIQGPASVKAATSREPLLQPTADQQEERRMRNLISQELNSHLGDLRVPLARALAEEVVRALQALSPSISPKSNPAGAEGRPIEADSIGADKASPPPPGSHARPSPKLEAAVWPERAAMCSGDRFGQAFENKVQKGPEIDGKQLESILIESWNELRSEGLFSADGLDRALCSRGLSLSVKAGASLKLKEPVLGVTTASQVFLLPSFADGCESVETYFDIPAGTPRGRLPERLIRLAQLSLDLSITRKGFVEA